MRQLVRLLCTAGLLVTMAACGTTPSVTAVPSVEPTTESSTVQPATTPTSGELAPEETFTQVGNVATLTGDHGVTGKAIVAGLQTLIIQGFSFDGKGSAVELRLVMGQNYANPALVLPLELRAYDKEMLTFSIPAKVGPGSADSIVVYCPETAQAYAVAQFD